MSHSLSEEEAKKEHDDILAEIAKEKGVTTEKPAEEKPESEDDNEPVDLDPQDKTEDDKKQDEVKEEDGEKDQLPARTAEQRIPLAKYQTLKKESESQLSEKDKEIQRLSDELNNVKSQRSINEKVKEFAAKHDMPEDTVIDLVTLVKGESTLDPEVLETVKKSQTLIKKQEAESAFETEFAGLIGEVPEAADVRDKIRTEAYKDGNLNKSLYEIYVRFVKPTIVAKKKTAEISRGGQRNSVTTEPDYAKIAENVSKNVPGALNNLTGEQQDKLFDYMATKGSRYSK